ncbi:hypothetical protein MIS45_07545 [Wielerella bovis]|nr:hypothetical protein [Wielerella bovis]ULJ68648.1 hypothetical protein MIS45_07545 [Wielerella bovis]
MNKFLGYLKVLVEMICGRVHQICQKIHFLKHKGMIMHDIDNNGVTFAKQDDFKRRPLAEKISRLLQQSDIDVSPMIIDGA